ncbi:alanine racemase [Bacillus sp. CGMCC 1.16607]|uniref:alanine racemase n=1 Tax=Bacillus sp. CGMCC 1.16607 TaxID=3351842 RepID=UPI003638284F
MEGQGYFYRDTWAEVNLDAISENIRSIKELIPNEVNIIAVVKANAYGHGAVQVAKCAIDCGAAYLAVAFLDEAIALREKGIMDPILVLGASRPRDIQVAVKHHITLTVFYYDWLLESQSFLEDHQTVNIHIKIDTGMGRIGIRTCEEVKAIEDFVKQDTRFQIEGVYTHFATADELDNSYLHEQQKKFEEILTSFQETPKIIHCSNSAAALRFPFALWNAVRIGIAMYGLTPSLEIEYLLPFSLKEAFSLHSRIVHVKKLQKGEKVSYGITYESTEEEWIGTLPIGYADGWIRKLQGQEVLVDGIRAPIVGRICMDQCMIKLPHYVPVGTKVTLIGEQPEERISSNEIAKKLDTINYEVPCIISNRVPRIYIQSGKVVELQNSLLSYD